jgi:hypothetical protein
MKVREYPSVYSKTQKSLHETFTPIISLNHAMKGSTQVLWDIVRVEITKYTKIYILVYSAIENKLSSSLPVCVTRYPL